MLKTAKIVLLFVALCFVFEQAVPSPAGYYWDGAVGNYGRGMLGPFYMGPYCNYKCARKCLRMGLSGVCDNYMCTCQQGRLGVLDRMS